MDATLSVIGLSAHNKITTIEVHAGRSTITLPDISPFSPAEYQGPSHALRHVGTLCIALAQVAGTLVTCYLPAGVVSLTR